MVLHKPAELFELKAQAFRFSRTCPNRDHDLSVDEGATLYLAWGSQGGAHLWGSFRARGVDPGPRDGLLNAESPLVEFRIEAGNELLSYGFVKRRNLWIELGGFVELRGEVVQLLDPILANGRVATFSVAVEDVCGARVSDSREITLIDPAAD